MITINFKICLLILTYQPPDRIAIGGPLLDNCFEAHMSSRQAKSKQAFYLGYKTTITTDGATNSKRPLSNVISFVPTVGPSLINYDDASDHLQDGGTKDARYYAELVYEGAEETGFANIVQIVTDCASVMTASWKQLSTCPEFSKL